VKDMHVISESLCFTNLDFAQYFFYSLKQGLFGVSLAELNLTPLVTQKHTIWSVSGLWFVVFPMFPINFLSNNTMTACKTQTGPSVLGPTNTDLVILELNFITFL
jgi:hypothetical protein